jgi:Na+-transporting NADH:ubiquinone oxidoreductase subunit NqrA
MVMAIKIDMTSESVNRYQGIWTHQLQMIDVLRRTIMTADEMAKVLGALSLDIEPLNEACMHVCSSATELLQDLDRAQGTLETMLENLDTALDAHYDKSFD